MAQSGENGAHHRLFALQRHLTAAAPSSARDALASDPSWAGKPVWLLCALPAGRGSEEELLTAVRQTPGARVVFAGYGRTAIGAEAFGGVLIVEVASTFSYAIDALLLLLLEPRSVSAALVIACRPGWWHLGRAAPAPTREITRFSEAGAVATPSGLVGEHVRGARAGATSATGAQASALVADRRLGDDDEVWHLNLLRFGGAGGKPSYRRYQQAMGAKGGILQQFGARSTLANECFPRALLQPAGSGGGGGGGSGGDCAGGFDLAIFACYPSKHAYLSMGASEEYRAAAHFRHEGLAETYIISCLPELVVDVDGRLLEQL
jgi:hypothetical protein